MMMILIGWGDKLYIVNFDTRIEDSTPAEQLLPSGPGIDRLSYRIALALVGCVRLRPNMA